MAVLLCVITLILLNDARTMDVDRARLPGLRTRPRPRARVPESPLLFAAMAQAAVVKFSGQTHLRHRLVLALLSGKPVRIDHIRSDDPKDPGLRGGCNTQRPTYTDMRQTTKLACCDCSRSSPMAPS